MLSSFDTFSLVMAVAGVGIFSFMFGSALDALTGSDGFGPVGNMIVLVGGFFGGIVLANQLGYTLGSLMTVSAVGLGGAFISFSSLALLKAGLRM